MKYVVAILSSVFIFIAVGILVGIILGLTFPKAWCSIVLNVGLFSANLPALIAAIIAGLAATHTFRASLRAKSFKLYKKKGGTETKDSHTFTGK